MTTEQHDILILRGKFIELTIDIESIMDSIISFRFCEKNKQHEFQKYILNEIMFNRKIELFKNILKNAYPKIYSKHSSDLDFKKLKLVRNKFAHDKISYYTNRSGKIDLTKLAFGDPFDGGLLDIIEMQNFVTSFNFFKKQLKTLVKILTKIIDE